MKVTRRRGVVRLMLDPIEAQVLAGLFDELSGAFDTFDPDDAVYQRLFPDGHRDDEVVAAEFRDLTESLLLDERVERLGQCRVDVASSMRESGKGSQIEMGPQEARRWLQVINDLRLAIGTRLGVTQERPEIDPTSDDAQAWAVYSWLSGVQEALVDAVTA